MIGSQIAILVDRVNTIRRDKLEDQDTKNKTGVKFDFSGLSSKSKQGLYDRYGQSTIDELGYGEEDYEPDYDDSGESTNWDESLC